jgi:hypothetical protein
MRRIRCARHRGQLAKRGEVFSVVSETPEILSAEQMKRLYGRFYDRSPRLQLDRRRVPEKFWPLLPYAEFWGIADDLMREILVKEAPPDVQHNLKQAVAVFDNAMDEWLAGPESDNTIFSDEYIAYSAMRMAADYI